MFHFLNFQKLLMFKPKKKYVGGSSAVPTVFLGILVHIPGLGNQQKYWRAHFQTDKPTKVMALFSCFLKPNYFFNFLSLLFFLLCLKRTYETLKQNLHKFKHSSHELRSWTILVSLNGTDDANLWPFSKKMLVFYNLLWILVKKS